MSIFEVSIFRLQSAGHSLGNLFNGSTCIITLSYQGLEETTAADDYQMDSLCLYLWFPFWVACTWEGIAPFCDTTGLCCRANSRWCKALLFAVNRYASLCSFVCQLLKFFFPFFFIRVWSQNKLHSHVAQAYLKVWITMPKSPWLKWHLFWT